MTEEVKEQPKIFSPDEIHEMFDSGFLAKLQEFARRTKKDVYPDKDINCFMARMELKFVDLETPLTYESIIKTVTLNLQPFFQDDIDINEAKSAADRKYTQIVEEADAERKAEHARIEGDGKDVGDE